jgi:hypothetical protein
MLTSVRFAAKRIEADRKESMQTKSIRLTEEEAAELDEYVRQSGEVEASVLKRAALRGLREDRIERAVLLYLRGASTSEAARLARLPRARFLDLLADKGVVILEAPSSLPEELDAVARLSGDAALAEAAEAVRSRGPAHPPGPPPADAAVQVGPRRRSRSNR